VDHAQEQGLSERGGCRLLNQSRGTQRYRPTQREDEDALTRAIIDLASQYGSYGYRRITAPPPLPSGSSSPRECKSVIEQRGLNSLCHPSQLRLDPHTAIAEVADELFAGRRTWIFETRFFRCRARVVRSIVSLETESRAKIGDLLFIERVLFIVFCPFLKFTRALQLQMEGLFLGAAAVVVGKRSGEKLVLLTKISFLDYYGRH
jgi:hypothetical protein